MWFRLNILYVTEIKAFLGMCAPSSGEQISERITRKALKKNFNPTNSNFYLIFEKFRPCHISKGFLKRFFNKKKKLGNPEKYGSFHVGRTEVLSILNLL